MLVGMSACSTTEIVRRYTDHARRVYVRADGVTPTRHADNVRVALKDLEELHPGVPAAELATHHLKALRLMLITKGLKRKTINARVNIIRQAWDWAAEMGLIPESTADELRTLRPLKRNAAPEGAGVEAVALETVRATIPNLPRDIADLVRFLLLTGCRVGEAREAHRDDVVITAAGDAFLCPRWHKTARHDIVREIPLNEPAYLLVSAREGREYLFGVGDGSKPYSKDAIYHAIRRACDRAGVAHWSPGQIRHTAATEIFVAEQSLEATASVLGHTSTRVTRSYVHARGNALALRSATPLESLSA
jgi:integrase